MKILHSNLLHDHLPHFGRSFTPKETPIAELPVKRGTAFTHEIRTIALEKEPDARLDLADSLRMLEVYEDTASHEQIAMLKAVIAVDAMDLAARVIPTNIADQLNIRAKRRDDTGFEQPPTLRDVYLLAYAYDATRSDILADSLTYILETQPPAFSDELAEAYSRAEAHDTSIMGEYLPIVTTIDNKLDGTPCFNTGSNLGDTAASPAPSKSTPEDQLGSTKAHQVAF